jgi:hypothetical protein
VGEEEIALMVDLLVCKPAPSGFIETPLDYQDVLNACIGKKGQATR